MKDHQYALLVEHEKEIDQYGSLVKIHKTAIVRLCVHFSSECRSSIDWSLVLSAMCKDLEQSGVALLNGYRLNDYRSQFFLARAYGTKPKGIITHRNWPMDYI